MDAILVIQKSEGCPIADGNGALDFVNLEDQDHRSFAAVKDPMSDRR